MTTFSSKHKLVTLTCTDCKTKAKFPASSPAAPALTASEASAKKGWSYEVGFFAMMTGDHKNRCPKCTAALATAASSIPQSL
jgi:hypothetical protein